MTREETAQILRIVKAEWRHDFKDMTRDEMIDRLNLWAEMFKDDDAGLVGAAVKSLIVAGNREFAPGVGQIKEQMTKLLPGHEGHTEAEAWARIRKAIRNSGYDSQQEYGRLPPILQKLVGSPSQLREWAVMDSETLNSVVRSYVEKGYRTMRQRENEQAKLPSDVKAAIGGLAKQFALEEKYEH